MKSIKTKMTAFMLAGILLTSLIIGGAGIYTSGIAVSRDAASIMELTCGGKARELDALLSRIEQSVQTVADYAAEQLDDVARFQTDAEYVDSCTAKVEPVLLNAADHTEGALAVYVRYNPEFTSPTSGLFCSRDSAEAKFRKITPTDFSRYDPSDVEHVGWYYIPVDNGKPTWMAPYLNKNINVEMISYVIPLQLDGVTVGVVGMDIDFGLLKQGVDSIGVFRTGYAFLADGQANIVYHRDYLNGTSIVSIDRGLQKLAAKLSHEEEGGMVGYELGDRKMLAVNQRLRNGMQIVLTVPEGEVYETRSSLGMQIFGEAILLTILLGGLTLVMARRMARPLGELNEAAQRIAEGDLSVSITYRSGDEIGALAESFRQTVRQLNQYINYIKGLAYRDPLTGVKSKTAYMETVDKLEDSIKISRPEFGVAVFDINGLKKVNDEYGHDFGDLLIISAGRVICKAFKHSPTYRIGGDEFAVILERTDLENYPELLEQLEGIIEEQNQNMRPELRVSIARGIAVYNCDTDLAYNDVFKRADSAMYHNKQHMKETALQEKTH